ncbi:aminoglycoside phosphotransferase family protein [Intrasporangium sp. YIM S08009]|uniref:aminoglycoside phosphotransferase family protein n=1 Tax=Intrasporangium zincisolvens TaxID=3080018 RepID=UPI002B059655|nr:aminoglycoside phosphotransferase family protein [Intrasporangium sp. YIM S08009]
MTPPADSLQRHADAIAWAQREIGADVASVRPLEGGLTSTMLALSDASGRGHVLRLMTNEPWRSHGAELTRRERDAQRAVASSPVPAPTSVALDADGAEAGVAAHLMTRLPGTPTREVDGATVEAMAGTLAAIHAVRPAEPFRTYQSWAWEAKRVLPPWTRHPASWSRAFELLAQEPPGYAPTFLHRDFSHRNLLWDGGRVSGVVDWVETSTGPAWLDAAHAATTLALAHGPGPARGFLDAYGPLAPEEPCPYWLVMDAVGFLPPPGREPLFSSTTELARLDGWLHGLVAGT